MGKWEFSQAGKIMLQLSLVYPENVSHLYCSVVDNSYLEFVQPQPNKLANLYQISNQTEIYFFQYPSSGYFFGERSKVIGNYRHD